MPVFNTSSFLVADSVTEFPIPAQALEAFPDIQWDEFEWDMIGLPHIGALYSLVGGKILYKDADTPDGEIKPEKSDFTGEVIFRGLLFSKDPNKGDGFLAFTGLFFKGELKEINFEKFEVADPEEYREKVAETTLKIQKTLRRNNSFWYKWIYTPYKWGVRTLLFLVSIILVGLHTGIVWLGEALTPWD